MCELKDEGLIVMKHVGDEKEADIFTKNTAAPVFNRHIPKFVGVKSTRKNAILNLELGKVLEHSF